jgi:hypothetical protein
MWSDAEVPSACVVIIGNYPHPKAGWVAALSGECYDLGFHEPRNSYPAPCGHPLANV